MQNALGIELETHLLQGYRVTYSGWNRLAQAGLLAQMPRLLRSIRTEHRWLQQLTRSVHIDGILSDNRYGLYHPHIPSVIITHQPAILTGAGAAADNTIRWAHYKMLQRFASVWVPDVARSPGLAARLSHPASLPPYTTYIGLLSRFAPLPSVSRTGTLLILLSGPEPARTTLAHLLWQQACAWQGEVIFAEGRADAVPPAHIPPHIRWYAMLHASHLQTLLPTVGRVVCRSGYSTIMDLLATGTPALLIPTPGQTEQQYLADTLHSAGIFYAQAQCRFHLEEAIQASAACTHTNSFTPADFHLHQSVLDQWTGTL